MTETRVTVAKGDGIGPEIMDACLDIINTADAGLTWEEVSRSRPGRLIAASDAGALRQRIARAVVA